MSAPRAAGESVHSKYLLFDGRYAGEHRKLVWTASHNYTESAHRHNDETLIKLDEPSVHRAFTQNFDALWHAAR
jgi:phosphatidylserine/phosphatidylglycerophosphate/cardiolipin synthase-like enzyme